MHKNEVSLSRLLVVLAVLTLLTLMRAIDATVLEEEGDQYDGSYGTSSNSQAATKPIQGDAQDSTTSDQNEDDDLDDMLEKLNAEVKQGRSGINEQSSRSSQNDRRIVRYSDDDGQKTVRTRVKSSSSPSTMKPKAASNKGDDEDDNDAYEPNEGDSKTEKDSGKPKESARTLLDGDSTKLDDGSDVPNGNESDENGNEKDGLEDVMMDENNSADDDDSDAETEEDSSVPLVSKPESQKTAVVIDSATFNFDKETSGLMEVALGVVPNEVDVVERTVITRISKRVFNEMFDRVEHKRGCLNRPFNVSIAQMESVSASWIVEFVEESMKNKDAGKRAEFRPVSERSSCDSIAAVISESVEFDVWNGPKNFIQVKSDLVKKLAKKCDAKNTFVRMFPIGSKAIQAFGIVLSTANGLGTFLWKDSAVAELDRESMDAIKQASALFWKSTHSQLKDFEPAQFLVFDLLVEPTLKVVRSISPCTTSSKCANLPQRLLVSAVELGKALNNFGSSMLSCKASVCRNEWERVAATAHCTVWFEDPSVQTKSTRGLPKTDGGPRLDETNEELPVRKSSLMECSPVVDEETRPIVVPSIDDLFPS